VPSMGRTAAQLNWPNFTTKYNFVNFCIITYYVDQRYEKEANIKEKLIKLIYKRDIN
jgi:hypothetical protein